MIPYLISNKKIIYLLKFIIIIAVIDLVDSSTIYLILGNFPLEKLCFITLPEERKKVALNPLDDHLKPEIRSDIRRENHEPAKNIKS